MGSKRTLLMKFGQFMSYYKRKNFMRKFYKNCNQKTSSRPFCVCKELSTASIGKWNFWRKLVKNSKTIKICQNQHAHLLKFLFTDDSLKIEKGLELVSRPHFSLTFLKKNFLLQYYINWSNLITRLYLLSKLFKKIGFMFHA